MQTTFTSHRKRLSALVMTALIAAAAAIGGSPTLVAAQETPARSADERADQLFLKAREAIQHKKFDVAYPLLLEAWSLRKADDIAGLLGQVELELGKHRDAAEHLTFSLRRLSVKDADKRQRLQAALQKAKREVMMVDLVVSQDNAQVLVDGAVVGTSPLADPIFLSPGEHMIEARLAGWERAQATLVAQRGSERELSLTLERASAAAVPATPATAGNQEPPAAQPESDQGVHSSSARTTVLVTEGAVLGVGLLVGTVFAFKTGADADDIQSARASGPSDGCSRPEYAAQCSTLTDARDRYDRDKTIRNAAFITAGVAGAAAVVTLLLWPSQERQSSSTSAGVFVGPGGGGISLASSF